MGLCRHGASARARRPGPGRDPAPDQARRHRANADHGRLPAVLGSRPRSHVRPRPRGQAGLNALLPVALRAARAGARVLLDGGLPRPGGPAELKSAGDYVTDSDRRSEAAIIDVLRRETPGIALLAEEAGGSRAGARRVRA